MTNNLNDIISLCKESVNSPEMFILTTVSVNSDKKLKEYLKGEESIVVDSSAFDSFNKAFEACKRYFHDFAVNGYTCIESSYEDGEYAMYVLHKGKEIEHIEISKRQLNYDICHDYYGGNK